MKYQFVPAGLGDTVEFWKLKNADPNDYMPIINKNGVTEVSADKLFPPGHVGSDPRWRPSSTQSYRVFEGMDEFEDSTEVWIPHTGSDVYLYRFLE